MESANDDCIEPRAPISCLSEEQAIEYAKTFFDQHCEQRDVSFLSEVVVAGERSREVTYQHAMRGSPIAQLVYGTAKLNGLHTEQNVSEGLFWLRRSFNNGNPKAAIVLAGAYSDGLHLPRNGQKACHYASFAAERALPAGQFILANLLIGGGDIPQDQGRAIALLQQAAKSGYAPARTMLEDNDIPFE